MHYLLDEFVEDNLEFDSVSFQNSWSFCLSLYDEYISYREVFLPIILQIFGNNSNEFRWAHSRNNGILDGLKKEDEYKDWEGRIISAENINDSIAVSTNILKSMAHEEARYRYDNMLSIGKKVSIN